MLSTEDSMLTNLQPSMEWDDWVEDIKKAIEDSNYHSDEVSESDIEKAQNEKDMMIRPSKREDLNHVFHVYDKPWRSSVVSINMFNVVNVFIDYLNFKFSIIDSKTIVIR